jgi:hypothetical protein
VLLVAFMATMESTTIVVMVPSSAPPTLTILDLVLDVVLAREGATKRSTTKFGKAWA